MQMNKCQITGIGIIPIILILLTFLFYFDTFFSRKKNKYLIGGAGTLFVVWQIVTFSVQNIPINIKIIVTILITLLSVMLAYRGKFWSKCVFSISFNAIWMLLETLCGYILILYFEHYATSQVIGSTLSTTLFLTLVIILKKIFMNDKVQTLPSKYSLILILIPTGSIYVMNNLFLADLQEGMVKHSYNSVISAGILLCMNILVFYIYIDLIEKMQLRLMNSVYVQQLEMCERHQKEREASILHLRDIKHNMKNNLISITAFAKHQENEKIIEFISEIMETGELNLKSICNTGNIVIDSLISYWGEEAKKRGISFFTDINIPMQMGFKGADISLILGNILENAVEAAERNESNKYVYLRMRFDRGNLIINLENTYKGTLIKGKTKKLITTKSDVENHGIGLESVYRTAEKYDGMIFIDDTRREYFSIRVVLYGQEIIT